MTNRFVEWAQQQWQKKPSKFWSSGLHDYLRHQAKIRREFADVIEEDNRPDGSSPGAKAAVYEPQLNLVPFCNTKIIHFVRHGEGFHNIGLITLDSHLTEKGWAQAHALGRHMYTTPPCHGVQLVIVSPMMRTLETAAGVFGIHTPGTGSSSNGSTSGGRPLSRPPSTTNLAAAGLGRPPPSPPSATNLSAAGLGRQPMQQRQSHQHLQQLLAHGELPVLMGEQREEAGGARVAHAAVHARPGIKFVAHELCRERLGPSQCDRRRPLSETRAAFPGVDFSLIEHEDDVMWETQHVESESAVVARGMKFMQYLMSRPETHIAVVTHSAFLWFTLACYGNEYSKRVRENLQRWYENCEMRTVVLSDGGGGGVADMTWFPGGHAYSEPQEELMEEDQIFSVEGDRDGVEAGVQGATPPAPAHT
ncbi:hypothetical protein N2152v2_008657 [Parachlorella kessleri]